MESNKHTELIELASMYIDGELDASGLAQLETLLAGNAEAQSIYVRFLTTHSDLSLLSAFGIPESGNSPADDTSLLKSELPNPRKANLGSIAPESPTPNRLWMSFAIVSVLAAIALVTLGYSLFSSGDNSVVEQPTNAVAQPEIVARIVRKIDCDWEGDRWAIDSSSKIHAGQTLIMRHGLMELEFTSGAVVTLEGPVAFTAESPMNGFLSQGKLTTYVPESAHGFTVDTPGTQTVDLGTEFGLFVGEDGSTETHVFDGEVIVKPSFAEKSQQEFLLTNDMAVRTEGSKTNSQQT